MLTTVTVTATTTASDSIAIAEGKTLRTKPLRSLRSTLDDMTAKCLQVGNTKR